MNENTKPGSGGREEKDVLKLIKFPVRYDVFGGGYFWDADNKMILQMRGWGWLQKLKGGEEKQDALGRWIAETLNASNELAALEAENEWREIRTDWDLPTENGEYLVIRWLSDEIVEFSGNPKRYAVATDEFEIGKGWRFTNPMAKVIAWRAISPFRDGGQEKIDE